MRILLTGKLGQVGWELERALSGHEVVATGRGELDLSRPEAIRDVFRAARPETVVNAAAYTAVDLAEAEPDAAMAVNGIAPGILAEEAKRTGALLVHYSTDYVFDGTKPAPYLESDLPNPINTYGRTKLEGERRITASGCRHLLLRTSWVYGPRGRNFFLAIANKALAGERLRVVGDQRGVPSESRFIAEWTRRLVERGEEGMLNLVPSGATTWHGFASAIVAGLGAPVEVQAISTAEYPSAARRPANSTLDNGKLASRLGAAPPWESLLERCLKAWNRP